MDWIERIKAFENRSESGDIRLHIPQDIDRLIAEWRVEPMSYDLEKLPERIKEAREFCNMTQVKLAARSGLDAQQIYQYEHGKCRPSAMALICLAMALGVPTDWLLGR